MSYVIEQISEERAEQLCRQITADLPEYFGLPECNEHYAVGVRTRVNFAVKQAKQYVGLLSLEFPYPKSANIYWMGVLRKYHHQGVGRLLLAAASHYAKNHDAATMTVETLAPAESDENYLNTYNFYESQGFKPLFNLKPAGYEWNMVYMAKELDDIRIPSIDRDILKNHKENLKQAGLDIQVIPATVEQKPIIAQLYELYTYEMTDLADFDIGDNGYYGYADLPHYWIDSNRFPYLVYVNKKLAGFVLVQQGSPVDSDPDVWDIAEFFIMRKFRRKGIGQFVAQQIWEKFAGPWQVRVWDNNKSAHSFWDGIIKRYSKNTAMLTKISYQGHDGLLIYKFNTTD